MCTYNLGTSFVRVKYYFTPVILFSFSPNNYTDHHPPPPPPPQSIHSVLSTLWTRFHDGTPIGIFLSVVIHFVDRFSCICTKLHYFEACFLFMQIIFRLINSRGSRLIDSSKEIQETSKTNFFLARSKIANM